MHKLTKTYSQLSRFTGNVHQIRQVSALHISGDKASENYVTLQPYLDFKQTFGNIEQLEHSISKRKLSIDVQKVIQQFGTYKQSIQEMDKLEDEREFIAKQLKEISKSKDKDQDLIEKLKEKGKDLRNHLKSMKTNFYPIEDEFMQAYLHLPNTLHNQCPHGEHDRLIYRSPQNLLEVGKSHLEHENVKFIDDSRYYLLNDVSEFDLRATQALARYFLDKGDFTQTANPDFTRLVLLEANATPTNHYYRVKEAHLQNNANPAYLTGGGSFESFLAAVTKLCVYPAVLPLKFVSCGRIYERVHSNRTPSLYTAVQNNAVQTFVATSELSEAEEHMENILNLCVDFYKTFNIHFRVVYINAAQLTPSESLRAQIEIYSPHEKRYVCVGRVSNYKDFVSKRILFTMRQKKDYHFLHLVGGPVLYTSRLIAALLEHGVVMDYEKLLNDLNQNTSNTGDSSTNAVNEFKSLFK